jgi:PAS domain S-box-containing protein
METFAPEKSDIFEAAFTHAAVGFAITDPSGQFLDVNNSFCRITGYSADELKQLNVLSITHPDYRKSSEELLRRLISGEMSGFVLQKEYVKKNGDLVWVQNSVSVVRDSDGDAANVVLLCEDISERRIIQNALRVSEERFRVQFKATPVPIFCWRRVEDDFVLVDYNEAADRITSHGIINLLGRRASHLYVNTPEAIEGMESCFFQKTTIRKSGEFRLLSTGELKYLDVSFVYVPPDLVMIHTEDITERIKAEQAKLEAERKYREMFEHANEGVFQTTPDGRFLTANPALARILGFDSPEELIRERTNIGSQQYPDADRREEFKKLLERFGVVRGFEYEAYRKDGTRIWMSDSVRAVRDQNQAVLFYEGIAEDITERKNAEIALRKQKAILQQIFDHIPVMINFIDATNGVQLVNSEWERTLGWTLAELDETKKNAFEVFYPDPDEREAVKKFIAEASGEWGNFRTRVKDGRTIDTSWAVVAAPDGMLIGIGKDVTQQKRAEHLNAATVELSHGLSGVRTPQEAATLIVEVVDRLFGWDSCSLQLYDAESDVIQPILSIDTFDGERRSVTPSHLVGPTPQGRRVIESGAVLTIRDPPIAFENNAVPFGDTRRPSASIMTVPIRYGTSVVGLLSIHSYETKAYDSGSLNDLQMLADFCGEALNRIRAEQSLYESEERFRQIAENIDDIIWVVDLSRGNLLYINPSFENVWGLPAAPLYENLASYMATIHPDDRKRVEQLMRARGKSGYASFEYRIVRQDGSVRWIRTRSFPIRDAEGKAYRLAGVAEDITERKRADTELRDFSRRLIEAQENERKQIARELHDEVGQVLTAVRINLQSLEQTCSTQQELGQIGDGIRVIDEALRRVRDLSFELRPSLLDDLGLAAATRWYVYRYAQRAGIKAEVEIADEGSHVRLDREVETACFRILQEALTNIARHAYAKHVFVLLTTMDNQLFLTIKDDGVGIESPTLQGNGSQRTTLGLRGMKERALAVNGNLEIVSALFRGTEVRASFPMVN